MTKWIAENFLSVQGALLAFFVLVGFLTWKSRSTGSQFRVREADLPPSRRTKHSPSKSPPLALPGINLHGKPHEVLGVSENASEADILFAYKEMIKKFHPDRMQSQALDPEQMKFYQEASTQINRAKELMLEKIRSRS